MVEDQSKKLKPVTPERGFGAPKIENKPMTSVPETIATPETSDERPEASEALRAWMNGITENINKRDATLDQALSARTANLPSTTQDEVKKIINETETKIKQNDAELQAEQEAAAKQIAELFNLSEAEANTESAPVASEPKKESAVDNELREKIEELVEEIDEQGIRLIEYYGAEGGYTSDLLGKPKFTEENRNFLYNKSEDDDAQLNIVKKKYSEAGDFDSLAYKLVARKKKLKELFQGNNVDAPAYFLSIKRLVQEEGSRANSVTSSVILPKELAIKINELFNKNPEAVQSLFLRLLPKNVPAGQIEELKKPAFIAGESSIKVEATLKPMVKEGTPVKSAEPMPVLLKQDKPEKKEKPAPVASEPMRSVAVKPTSPPVEVAPTTPEVPRVVSAPAERSMRVEQLLAERRTLQREWEKEAAKLIEQKMSKDERQQYSELLTGRVVKKSKKGKFTAEERKKFIEDVGFDDADYEQMKTGSKPWILNAIWKRLGEIDKEVVLGSRGERQISAPISAPEISAIAPTNQIIEQNKISEKPEFKEAIERAKILDKMFSHLEQENTETRKAILEQIAQDPRNKVALNKKSKETFKLWQKNMDIEEIRAILVPHFGNKEEINKLWSDDLEKFKDHFIKNLENVIKLTEEKPASTPVKAELGEENQLKTLNKERLALMKKHTELKAAVKRGEKGAEKKLRTNGTKLEELREKISKLKKAGL